MGTPRVVRRANPVAGRGDRALPRKNRDARRGAPHVRDARRRRRTGAGEARRAGAAARRLDGAPARHTHCGQGEYSRRRPPHDRSRRPRRRRGGRRLDRDRALATRGRCRPGYERDAPARQRRPGRAEPLGHGSCAGSFERGERCGGRSLARSDRDRGGRPRLDPASGGVLWRCRTPPVKRTGAARRLRQPPSRLRVHDRPNCPRRAGRSDGAAGHVRDPTAGTSPASRASQTTASPRSTRGSRVCDSPGPTISATAHGMR